MALEKDTTDCWANSKSYLSQLEKYVCGEGGASFVFSVLLLDVLLFYVKHSGFSAPEKKEKKSNPSEQ